MATQILDLAPLFVDQAKLDATIHNNHQVNYESTMRERTLALLVELGELANATRCFKYWSSKPSESKERVIDEYVDGLHFFLSLGVANKLTDNTFVINEVNNNLTTELLIVYQKVSHFLVDFSNYVDAFNSFLSLIPLLGFSKEDVINAYYKKLGVNYVRQETNY